MNKQTFIKSKTLLASMVATVCLGAGAAAQPAATEPVNAPAEIERSETQPVIRTYEKFPDSEGDDQDKDYERYSEDTSAIDGQEQDKDYVRYSENPDVLKAKQGETEYVRYPERNDANDNTPYKGGKPSQWKDLESDED